MENKLPDVKVKINEKKEYYYPVFIGENLIQNAQEYINQYTKAQKLLVVTNKTIMSLYPQTLKLKNAEFIILEDGEQYKNFDTYKQIMEKALELKLERQDALIAFGGGVIGDVTGFCAATYLRGIDFIQIPTTLLAQVDSSVGGKVAINTSYGKNLVGAFYQPKLVLSDTNTLKTLDKRQYKTGLAEVVKYAFIEKTAKCNFNFFEFMEHNTDKIKAKDPQTLKEMIKICCEIKAKVVNEDEQEKGLRTILNFGHTFAHAIEKATNFTHFTHGEAVAIGMRLAFDLAKSRNAISNIYYSQAISLLTKYGLTYVIPQNITKEELISAMYFDKKVQCSKVRFVLPKDFCEVELTSDIEAKNSLG